MYVDFPDLFVVSVTTQDSWCLCEGCEDIRVYFASEQDAIDVSKGDSDGIIVKKGEVLCYVAENSNVASDLGCAGSRYYNFEVLKDDKDAGYPDRRHGWTQYDIDSGLLSLLYDTYDDLLELAVKK